MADKRKASMSGPSPKRPRVSNEGDSDNQSSVLAPSERPRNNPVYGQKSAFPGLDDGGDELFYGPADDGLEYLRMVRSEASALPSLFVAPTSKIDTAESIPTAQIGPSAPGPQSYPLPAGFFEDEAYIAPVDTNKTVAPSDELYPEAQVSYYNLLRHRFRLLRSTLRCTPPATAIAALDETHPISLPRNNEAARKEWRRLLLTVDPQMVQLACMDSSSVLGVLGILARNLSENVRSGSTECVRRIGAWSWGLLGKCREIGELATEDVGVIRDLGKRAVKILQKVREEEHSRSMEEDASESEIGEDEQLEDAALQETTGQEVPPQVRVPDGGDSDMPDAADQSDELETAKARLQAQLQDNIESEMTGETKEEDVEGDLAQQIRAMLDMIITVAGEFFGQRDLLDVREVWTS